MNVKAGWREWRYARAVEYYLEYERWRASLIREARRHDSYDLIDMGPERKPPVCGYEDRWNN